MTKVMPFNCVTGAGVMSKVMLEIFNDINAEEWSNIRDKLCDR